MTVHIGVDADAGLMHAVAGTAANVNDVTQGHALMHGQETDVYADAGYQGVAKRDDTHNMTLRPLQRSRWPAPTPTSGRGPSRMASSWIGQKGRRQAAPCLGSWPSSSR